MKKRLTFTIIAGLLVPFTALAQERAGDAALGAVSGAIVLGPVGAVAGAIVGYTAGPSIARSWGLNRSASHGLRRAGGQSTTRPSSKAANNPAPQHVSAQGTHAVGPAPKPAGTASVTPPRSPEKSMAASNTPEVQGFE